MLRGVGFLPRLKPWASSSFLCEVETARDLEAELDALREAGFCISDALYERALEMDAE